MTKSGVLMIWSLLCPLVAAILCSIRFSSILFAWFSILVIFSVIFDNYFSSLSPLQPTYNRQFFIINFLTTSVILFFIILYSAKKIQKQTVLLESQKERISNQNSIITKEKNRVDALLRNTLPPKIIEELHTFGKTTPENFETVSVMFTDFKGFTELSSSISPHLLISELNEIFTAFDHITEKNSCERIKTIGDAYLAVCGMPEKDDQHAINIINSAIEFIEYLKKRNKNHARQPNHISWEIRIGIHSGPVIGSIVGIKKYIYDVFGDTINTASRMENHSEPMKINISSTTYNFVKNKYRFIERTPVNIKGKGMMIMYYLDF